ncbi:epidermal differentiation-specific protein-like [Clarias gariepinus]|uniref:epidermal differentiation-specific protein-like n=1 Tax=Clarias gariepinus TaxID=13013 RepID=UPI00234C3107|nr:epidermal differentiation-specific protein-like [Clarias gariepinus]
MNKIIVYDGQNFEGISREFTSDVPNLTDENFNNCISSLKVIGNPWVAYKDTNFTGEPTIYEDGEYPNVYYDNDLSSLELVTENLDDPQITLYEEENYKGRSLIVKHETNLLYGTFNDTASSHKVQRGAWALYQHRDRGGYVRVARAGHDMPKYEWFDNRLTYLCPLKAGHPSIKAEVEWDKMKEHEKTVTLVSITGINNGSEKQSLNTELNREFRGYVNESFKFSESSQIGVGTKFEIIVSDVKTKKTFNVRDTFPVEKGSSNTRTTTEGIKVAFPASVPPHTKLTVNVVRKKVIITVPVKLTITTGFTSKVENGEYRCEDGNSITTEYKEVKMA